LPRELDELDIEDASDLRTASRLTETSAMRFFRSSVLMVIAMTFSSNEPITSSR
jgi:hypothetical protein